MIKDYGRSFFIKKFEQELENRDHNNINKYFSLLQAKLYIEKGQMRKAKNILDKLLLKQNNESNYENIFLARLYEALAICEDRIGKNSNYEKYLYKFYIAFPQLIPYSDLKMELYLDVKDNGNKTANDIINQLKACNIKWTTDKNKEVPHVILRFSTNGQKNAVTYKVESVWGKSIVPPQDIVYEKPDGIGKKIASGIFKLGTTIEEPLDYEY
jgi:hypothetical protein